MKKIFLTALILLLFQLVAICQPPPPKPKDIPLDGGLTLLLAAGIAYGGKKIYNENKKSKTN